ncbi:hypothetical protein A5732_03060 [Mycobacterium colombiense]|nr:hypothetical protein A5732_03060 [Mycobacterium colombiense]
MHTIEADYLVVGAGVMGMAFIDTLVAETEARVVVMDRHHAPGGHWTLAYPFVRLHQPSAFYGVNSSRLGSDAIDQVGWNRGLFELATAGEICAYYDRIMPKPRVRERILGIAKSVFSATATKLDELMAAEAALAAAV